MCTTSAKTARSVALGFIKVVPLLVSLLLLGSSNTEGQPLTPELPEEYQQKEYGPLFKGVNLCAYKEVLQNDGNRVMAWVCGPVDGKNTNIKYDCCPGYKRTSIVNNECVEKTPTYMTIIPTLAEMNKVETADILHKVEPGLDKNGKDFTVFVPENDPSTQNILESDIGNLIVDGRHYSSEFKNGANIITKTGYPLKVSTHRNGLFFVECQLLTKPDYETSNGLVHVTGRPIDASNRYSSVLQRLQDDPEISAFTDDIPSDLRRQLGAENSKEWYTVFAPTNSAWQAAKRNTRNPKQDVADLVRQHVHDGLTCAQSLDAEKRLLGPSKSNTFIRGMQQPGGSKVLEDSCGAKATFQQMDMMAGNGVVHKINSVLQSPASMDFRKALDCLANGPDSQLSYAAREMAACNIDVQPRENVVVLLPTREALRQSSGGCALHQNHVLTSRDCNVQSGHGIGTPQECLYTTKYTAPDGRHPTVTNQYIPTRDGSRLHFGKAETTGMRPIPFKDGVIYPVSSVNPPPKKTMMEIIRDNADLTDTYKKMQQADFGRVLNQHSPNVVFFAPQNHGWKTRDKENAYGQGQLRRALAIGDPIVASDGVVSVVDWPLVCESC